MSSPTARIAPYLQVAPLLTVLLLFFGIPLLVVVAFSFFDFDGINSVPAFVWANYAELFTSKVTLSLYLKTVYYATVVWAITLVVGFTVAYFLVFHVRSIIWQMALFLLCTVPFWTSNIIRMISWIPFLGRNGIFNQALMGAGITQEPLEFLLFSDFAVITAYVHLFTLFMIVPIFNSMARIDRSLIAQAGPLLKLIANLIEPTDGRIVWWSGGFDKVGATGRSLAFVFQDPTLMPWARVETNVRLPLDLAHVPRSQSRGPVAEATTREQCNALYPGSNPGRASSLRWLRQLRLGKPSRSEGCPAVARRAKADRAPNPLISPLMARFWGFRGCGIWSKDHPRARVTRALGLGDARHARPFFVPNFQSES